MMSIVLLVLVPQILFAFPWLFLPSVGCVHALRPCLCLHTDFTKDTLSPPLSFLILIISSYLLLPQVCIRQHTSKRPRDSAPVQIHSPPASQPSCSLHWRTIHLASSSSSHSEAFTPPALAPVSVEIYTLPAGLPQCLSFALLPLGSITCPNSAHMVSNNSSWNSITTTSLKCLLSIFSKDGAALFISQDHLP